MTVCPVFANWVPLNWTKVVKVIQNFLVCMLNALRKHVLRFHVDFKSCPTTVPSLQVVLMYLSFKLGSEHMTNFLRFTEFSA